MKLLIIPGQLTTFQSLKDRTLKLTFETAEPTPEQVSLIMQSLQTAGYIAFNSDPFEDNEKELLKHIKADFDDTKKTKSQRLRAVLYRNFEQDNKNYEVFDDYYNHYMELIINHYKSKLD